MYAQHGDYMSHQPMPGDGWWGDVDFSIDDVHGGGTTAGGYSHPAHSRPLMNVGQTQGPPLPSSHHNGFESEPLFHLQQQHQPYQYQQHQQPGPQNAPNFSHGNPIVRGNKMLNPSGIETHPFQAFSSSNNNNSGAFHCQGFSYQDQPRNLFPKHQRHQMHLSREYHQGHQPHIPEGMTSGYPHVGPYHPHTQQQAFIRFQPNTIEQIPPYQPSQTVNHQRSGFLAGRNRLYNR